MMLVEYGDAAIAIDCGLMFPGADLLGRRPGDPGCELSARTAGQAKGDRSHPRPRGHVGALPYILNTSTCRSSARALTLGLPANKLREHGLEDTADIRQITAGEPWEIAPFKIEGIRVTHSLMDCLALGHRNAPRHDRSHRRLQDRQHAHGRRDVRFPEICRVRRKRRAPALFRFHERRTTRPYSFGTRSGSKLEQIIQHSTGKVLVSTFSSGSREFNRSVDISRVVTVGSS